MTGTMKRVVTVATIKPPITARPRGAFCSRALCLSGEGGARLSHPEDGLAGSPTGVGAQGESDARTRLLLPAGAESRSRDGAAVAGRVGHPRDPSRRPHAARCLTVVNASLPAALSGGSALKARLNSFAASES